MLGILYGPHKSICDGSKMCLLVIWLIGNGKRVCLAKEQISQRELKSRSLLLISVMCFHNSRGSVAQPSVPEWKTWLNNIIDWVLGKT